MLASHKLDSSSFLMHGARSKAFPWVCRPFHLSSNIAWDISTPTQSSNQADDNKITAMHGEDKMAEDS
jgi:hypothetical protein